MSVLDVEMAISPLKQSTVSLILLGLVISILTTLIYTSIFWWMASKYYLSLIYGTYLILGFLSLLQMARIIRMNNWVQRIGAFGVIVGFATIIFLGLRPRPACLDTGSCLSGITPRPTQLIVGIVIMTASLVLDWRFKIHE